MAKTKFSGCSVSVTPGGNVSFSCILDPKSDCDFFIEKPGAKVPWDNCDCLELFGFCGSKPACKNAMKQAMETLSKRS